MNRAPSSHATTPASGCPLFLLTQGGGRVAFSLAATQIDIEATERPVLGSAGAPLPAGCAIEPGFFSKATLSRPFAGTWTPLVGSKAHGPNRDIPWVRSGMGREAPGCFRWCRAYYVETDELPPAGVPLAIRFYDHADPGEARFHNTASHPSWWFRSPRAPVPSRVEVNLTPDASWESGPDGAFRAALPLSRAIVRFFSLFGRHSSAASF